MAPHYTVDLLALLAKHQACSQDTARELVRTPSIRTVLCDDMAQIDSIVAKLPLHLP